MQNQNMRQGVLSFVCLPAWAVSWVTCLLVSWTEKRVPWQRHVREEAHESLPVPTWLLVTGSVP